MIASVKDASQVGEARRSASEFARGAGGDENLVGRVALVVTEMATNLVKHAGEGAIVIDRFDDADGQGLEILSLDRGHGIADWHRAMTDGYSTAGSPGGGLGAMSRQADQLGVFSRPGSGTAIMARLLLKPASAERGKVTLGAVVLPYPGEQVCGDNWAFGASAAGPTLLVVDGSGHGLQAARAAEIATKIFLDHIEYDCPRLAAAIHQALAPTRGAAMALARVDAANGLVRYVGVGNICGAVISGGETRRMVSHNGTAGHIAPRIQEFAYPFVGAPIVVMHSDG
ncbi:MAG: anti-sigma regulatory factor, partial [Rhodospirillales bacterium]|nr:anti-sigma regulatory factor [Rhodospirillales bacterium]